MLHRAMFGSLERFMGILIEHHAGNLPLWLAPLQVKVLTITSDAMTTRSKSSPALRAAGMRAESDLRNEKISYKVREHSVAKVPVHCSPSASEKSKIARSRCAALARSSSRSCRSTTPSRPSWPRSQTGPEPSHSALCRVSCPSPGRKRDATCTLTVRHVTDSNSVAWADASPRYPRIYSFDARTARAIRHKALEEARWRWTNSRHRYCYCIASKARWTLEFRL